MELKGAVEPPPPEETAPAVYQLLQVTQEVSHQEVGPVAPEAQEEEVDTEATGVKEGHKGAPP